MDRYTHILSTIEQKLLGKDIDDLKCHNFLIEYPVPDIITLDWKTILEPPSSNSSNKTKQELNNLINITNNRSKKDLELLYNIDTSPEYYLVDILDKLKLDTHINHLKELYKIIKPILFNVKYLFNRPRPYQLAEIYKVNLNTIHTLTHHTPSYPSGHTVYCSLYKELLSYYYPEYIGLFDSAVRKTILGRELQGVHFHSDNLASIKMSKILFNHLYPKVLQ